MSAGDIREREIIIEKVTVDQAQQDQPRRRNGERKIWLYGAKTREEKGASEMPGAPIKVEIGGFASVNPTSRRRRVGGKKQGRNKPL